MSLSCLSQVSEYVLIMYICVHVMSSLRYAQYTFVTTFVLQIGSEERLLQQYCDCHVTRTGILTAVQDVGCPHSLVAQLVDEWLDRYRRIDKRREAAACSNYDSDS